ncbi:hypothetical protein AURDEDRAFT_109495 [Auricularia subglabra TFB-10046 SS5]|nr:hypothetical protein AURDEDRAFT_109495 [Auricularia subglabra TFB-10046 SS5]
MSTPSPTGTRPSSPDAGSGNALMVSLGPHATVPRESQLGSHTRAGSAATRVTPPPQTQTGSASVAPPAGTHAPPAGTHAPHPTAPQPQVHASQTGQHAQAQVHGPAAGTTTPVAGSAPPVAPQAPDGAPANAQPVATEGAPQAPPPQLLPSGTRLVRCNYLGCGRWFAGNDRRAHASVHCVTTHLRFQALAEALAAPFLSDHQVA